MAPRAAPSHDLLRFLTCGSVDDGKSTLIGRMLYDAGKIHDDQMETLRRDSARVGTTGGDLDLALLVDGLEAEREQGITIDVAWRFFATARRSFIVADTPGHEQYTRNMATGASTCDLAVVLADARKGVLVQTRRHAFICSLMRVRHVVLAVNKMDLVGWDQALFDEIAADFAEFATPLGFESVMAIPVSARFGDNVAARSAASPWWTGPTLMERLETVPVDAGSDDGPFRFPVEWTNRPNADFRGYAGTVVSGRIRVGDEVVAATSGRRSKVARIVTYDGDLHEAAAGEAPTLTLTDEIDVARGEILCRPEDRPVLADQFAAHVVWMAEEPLLPGRSYLMRMGTRWVPATVTSLRRRIDVNTLEPLAARRLELNEIGVCNLSTAQPVAFDPYAENRATGGFILVDRMTNQTLAAGTVDFALRRATNIHPEPHTIDRAARAAQKGQRPVLVWFTGLSGSGKSTIADIVERELNRAGCHTYLLDGDNVRHGLNRDLGFTDQDRVENIRRVGEVARLMTDAGLIVLASFISPFEAERLMVRELFAAGDFVEVFVDTPLELCKARDPKGLYRRAEAGLIRNFTGVDSPYERPSAPELVLRTPDASPEALAQRVVDFLKEHGVFG